MKKKKIAVLHAQVPFVSGGAELMVNSLTKQLQLRGFNAELVSLPFKWYPANTLLDSYLMWRMLDLDETNGEEIDLAIATKLPTYMIRHHNKALWLMHQHRVAYDLIDNVPAGGFNTIPNGHDLREKIVNMDNIAMAEFEKRYSISQNVSNRLEQYNGFSSTPLYHPPSLAGNYYAEGYGDYILSIGRLDKMKRLDLLIESLKYCDRKIKAVIGGKGPEKEHLEQLARKLGVADRVKFLGFVEDKELLNLYANALGVYFAPLDEDYGYITLEAFFSKRPVFTCRDSGGVLEFAKNSRNACVVNFDPKEMGTAFNKLYKNKKLAKEYGEEGYKVVKDISWDYVVDVLTESIR